MAMKQAMSMTPEQRQDLAKLGEQLFNARKRHFTETPTEEDLKNDRNIEFVDEKKQKPVESIPVIELGSSYKRNEKKDQPFDSEKSHDSQEKSDFSDDDFRFISDNSNFFDQIRNMMSGSTKKKIEIVKETGVRFKDVAGIDEAKVEIMEFIDFLKNQEKYLNIGARIPKGALLSGPPGTGKTLLAKAAAGEASVPFLYMSGSDFIELYAGVGAKRVRELFAEARKNAPCIVFIDEIDAIGKRRNGGRFSGASDEREQTLNQILVEMDGFKSSDNVVVIASTNRADILDPALLRAGRFDRHIDVEKPDLKGRRDIAQIYLKRVKLHDDRDLLAQRIAELTPGYTGADISNIINEAALLAVRRGVDEVWLQDVMNGADRVMCGMKKESKVMQQRERQRIAYHEAGHAVIGWLCEHTDPCLKVSIIPRTNGALGFTQSLPKELAMYSEVELKELLIQIMGGRAGEKVCVGDVTTGSQDDLKKGSEIAESMVTSYGFSEKLGPVCYSVDSPDEQGHVSEETARIIEEEKKRLMIDAYNQAIQILQKNRGYVDQLAKRLLEKETVTSVDLEQIMGKRRGVNPDGYSDLVKDLEKELNWIVCRIHETVYRETINYQSLLCGRVCSAIIELYRKQIDSIILQTLIS